MIMNDSDAPELVGLTTELQDNLNELRTKVAPLLEKVYEYKIIRNINDF